MSDTHAAAVRTAYQRGNAAATSRPGRVGACPYKRTDYVEAWWAGVKDAVACQVALKNTESP